ncbi:hypothetical protein ACFORG_04630 [Lutimaribacter marinistellae]|uniref:Glycosyl transferases group 1 n=1 Tax=Lutimaribacter marinistellae TaxID=1820329 RepID=A0ABV7TE19_9RHOB
MAFFPCSGPEQSDLLRGYLISDCLRQMGWASIVVPMQLTLQQRKRIMQAFQPDIVVLRTCRHALNRVEHFPGCKVVLDLDDADFFHPPMRDAITQTARDADGVICGSRFVRDWAAQHNPDTTVIWTGTPISDGPWPDHGDRERIVTWAQSDPLIYNHEFDFIEEVVLALAARGTQFRFRFYGWNFPEDHPKLARLREAGVELELIPSLAYEKFLGSLRDVAVGLSPVHPDSDFSKGKSFGKILAYIDAKVPVICSDAVDHALFFTSESGIVSNDPEVWVDRIAALLDDPACRQTMADNAHDDFRERLSVETAARLSAAYLERVAHV